MDDSGATTGGTDTFGVLPRSSSPFPAGGTELPPGDAPPVDSLLADSLDVLTVLEPDGTWRYTSPAGSRLLGYPRGFDPDGGIFSLIHPDDVERAAGAFASFVAGTWPVGAPIEVRVRDLDGDEHIVETVGFDRTDDPAIRGIVLHSRDVTDVRRAEAVLRSEERRFRSLLRHASEYTLVWGLDFVLSYVSPSVVEATSGYLDVGVDIIQDTLVHPDDLATVVYEFDTLLAAPVGSTARVRFRLRMGPGEDEYRWLDATVTNLVDDADVAGIVVNARDVTEIHAQEEELEHRATHDSLTGLANRHQLMTVLDDRLRTSDHTAVLFCDLDDFKAINDTHGHLVGDRLLVAVAHRLAASVRSTDLVARFGGDEFVVLCPDTDDEVARDLTERIRSSLRAPFAIGPLRLRVSASIGIAATGDRNDATTLVRQADVAMYRAKADGRDRASLFEAAS